MDEASLIRLLAGYRLEDAQSAQLLEAYLDRAFSEWRQHAAAHEEQAKAASGEPTAMSKEDALRVLGLEAGASEAEIKAAYHRLISSLHPDRGGSGYLAAQVNRARDVLLGR
jgi:DnaJ-domain-containing protein 1